MTLQTEMTLKELRDAIAEEMKVERHFIVISLGGVKVDLDQRTVIEAGIGEGALLRVDRVHDKYSRT